MKTQPTPFEGPDPKDPAGVSAQEIKTRVHRRLLETLNLVEARKMPVEQLYGECSRRVDMLLKEQRCPLTAPEKQQLLREVMDEIFGLGPLEEFLRDPTISDVLANGPHQVYIERNGVLEETNASFRDAEHLMQIIQRIGARVGRRIDESSPMLDARLADGSRVNAIIPPLSLDGPTLSIRRFGTMPLDLERLIELETLTAEMGSFLKACVGCKMNVLISGGTGSGKTTLLNILSRWIPVGERVVTIEDAAELQLQRKHVVRLETRPPNIEGRGEITQRGLLRNSLRMRPDRIIIGEVRGAEALDMLQAMNTGHEGSMTTVHANNPRDALRRVENMVSMAGLNYPMRAMRQQMSSALDLVIHLSRLTGGKRKVVSVAEITGIEGDTICLQDLFRFNQTGVGQDGHAMGHFEVCGVRPQLLERLRAEGVSMPEDAFQRRILKVGSRPA
ncbi:MAG: pilus assembly protein CpaF [Phycisphaerae bacterium SM23_33]|jgi:pilus assembly protein CpaF|nr:MAG: pilus assembly protein CpaF [Phycisphaerae bacterium SM23_33]